MTDRELIACAMAVVMCSALMYAAGYLTGRISLIQKLMKLDKIKFEDDRCPHCGEQTWEAPNDHD